MTNLLAGKHILIIVENLPLPFDRRVWQEANTLKENGAEVSVICPQNLNVYSHILSGNYSRVFWLNGTSYPSFGHSGQSLGISAKPVANTFCTLTTIANDSIKRSSIYVNGKNGAVLSFPADAPKAIW